MTKFLCGECIHNSDKGGGCLIPKNLGYVDNCNRYLPKDRPIVQTNEEYMRSCTTEQLAEVLLNAIQKCKRCASGIGVADDDDSCPIGGCWEVKDVVEWLKQPHGGEL